MEMSQIRYFLAAARALNFTRAAAECQVSQPALTKAIRSLEDELGGLLFHRDGRRVLLSDLGRSMMPHLQQIAERAELARSVAENFRLLDKVPIRLGVMSTIGPVRLSRMLAKFQQDHEGVEVSVHEGSIADLKSRLEEGELDLVMLNPLEGLGSGFHADPLYEERYVVIFPPGHRLAEKNGIGLGELSGEAYVDRLACEMREMVMGVCRDCQVELYARFRSEREDWIQAMVLARIGFAFMPEYSVTLPELSQRPLIAPAVKRKIALVSVPGRRHSPAVAAFARAAKSFSWPG